MKKSKVTAISTKIEEPTTKNTTSFHPFFRLTLDLGIAFLVLVFGWFLTGWLTQGSFLETQQSDWYVQAYRIDHLQSFGPISWDSSLGGGVSMWRAYPFVIHSLALGLKLLFSLSTTQAMIWLTVSTFIALRVSMYLLLRSFSVRRLPALLTTLLSFTVIQQWGMMQDFVFVNSLVFVPLFVFLWKKSIDHERWFWVLSAVTGALFSVSTTLASILAFFWFFLVIAMSTKRISVRTKIVGIIFFLIAALPQTAALYTYGATFLAPVYASPQLLELSLSQEYLGLGLPLMMLGGLTWLILLAQSKSFPQWAKMLLLFCTLILAFIMLSPSGLPQFILQLLRVPQTLTTIGLISCFAIAQAFNRVAQVSSSRFIGAVFMVLAAILITQSLAAASEWGIQPVKTMSHGASQYFTDHAVQGRVFIRDVSRAVYFLPRTVRFASLDSRDTQILTTQPVSQRLQQLLRNDMKYTGVSEDQIKAVQAYSQVLGVEYLILPQDSPFIPSLTASRSGVVAFAAQDSFTDQNNTFVILQHQDITPLAVGTQASLPELEAEDNILPKPSILSNSWRDWDAAVYETVMALQVREGIQPVSVQFDTPDQITLSWDSETPPAVIYLQQSYDAGWKAEQVGVAILPTNLQFTQIQLASDFSGSTLTLKHHWPKAHWPIQSLAAVTVAVAIVVSGFSTFIHKRKKSHAVEN